MIFGIGVSKTGSNSLIEALRLMGLNCCHLGSDWSNKVNDHKKKIEKNIDNSAPILEGIPRFDAIADYPLCLVVRQLIEQHPDAKFVLTYRPPQETALSWCRMVNTQHRKFKDPPSFSKHFNYATRHLDRVFRLLHGHDKKLLVLDARDSSQTKWQLLSRFVELPAPDGVDFPHAFNHSDWQTDDKLIKDMTDAR